MSAFCLARGESIQGVVPVSVFLLRRQQPPVFLFPESLGSSVLPAALESHSAGSSGRLLTALDCTPKASIGS